MIQSFIYTTERNNYYLYDDQSRLSLLIHPEIKNAHENKKNVNKYYLKKYNYLKKHGFFSKSNFVEFATITDKMVKESIINTEQIVFEVTDSCNLNCKYCGLGELYEGFDIRSDNKINIYQAELLLKYIYKLKVENNNNKLMIGFYGGEPLMNFKFIKQFIEVVNHLNYDKKIEIGYSMTTNATLVHKYVDFLVANKFRLLISLDGNEINNSYRVFKKNKKNSFQKVIDNIDMIQKNHTKYFDSHIMFNAVLHNQNSVKDIYEYIYTRYQKIPIISELKRRNIKPEREGIVENLYHSRRISESEYIKEDSIQIPVTHPTSLAFVELSDFLTQFSINYYLYNVNALLFVEEKYYPTSTCLPFAKRIFLTTNNKLLPCEQVNFKYALGKIEEKVMIDLQSIARRYNFYYNHLGKVCAHCYAYRFCGECMLQINYLNKLNVEDFVCSKFFDQKSFGIKLYRIFSFIENHPNLFFQILENEQTNIY